MPADEDGSSDPIVLFYHLGSLVKSSTFPKTLNPSWNEKIVIETYSVNGFVPPMIATVWDKDIDFIGKVDHEFIGSALIKFSEENVVKHAENLMKPKDPKWFDLRIRKNEMKGKLMCSFSIVNKLFFR